MQRSTEERKLLLVRGIERFEKRSVREIGIQLTGAGHRSHTYIHTLLYLPSDFRVANVANISEHLTIAWEIDHHTGNYVPYSFRQVRGFFNVPC